MKYKFRVGWFGRLVLQRFSTWEDDGHKYGKWVNATVGDLAEYYAQKNESNK